MNLRPVFTTHKLETFDHIYLCIDKNCNIFIMRQSALIYGFRFPYLPIHLESELKENPFFCHFVIFQCYFQLYFLEAHCPFCFSFSEIHLSRQLLGIDPKMVSRSQGIKQYQQTSQLQQLNGSHLIRGGEVDHAPLNLVFLKS